MLEKLFAQKTKKKRKIFAEWKKIKEENVLLILIVEVTEDARTKFVKETLVVMTMIKNA